MNYLTIDTTKQTAYVLAEINKLEYKQVITKDEKHNETLLPKIDYIMSQANAKISDIDTFVVVTGPGSFTGIRVGISSVKAFVQALEKNVFDVTNFDVLANIVGTGVVLLNCTHSSSYFCVYESGEQKEAGVIENKKVNEKFGEMKKYVLSEEQNKDTQEYINLSVIENFDECLRNISKAVVKTKRYVDVTKIEPYYLQLSQAEREKAK